MADEVKNTLNDIRAINNAQDTLAPAMRVSSRLSVESQLAILKRHPELAGAYSAVLGTTSLGTSVDTLMPTEGLQKALDRTAGGYNSDEAVYGRRKALLDSPYGKLTRELLLTSFNMGNGSLTYAPLGRGINQSQHKTQMQLQHLSLIHI